LLLSNIASVTIAAAGAEFQVTETSLGSVKY
jgi:hypothetical protein